MLVKVKTNFIGQVDLDAEPPTLKEVLLGLSKRSGIPILDSYASEVHSDFKIYLNGMEYESLSCRLETGLKNGDRVEVNLIVLAGG
jgi:hypothetical protein